MRIVSAGELTWRRLTLQVKLQNQIAEWLWLRTRRDGRQRRERVFSSVRTESLVPIALTLLLTTRRLQGRRLVSDEKKQEKTDCAS